MAVSKASRQKKAKRKTQRGGGGAGNRSARSMLLDKMRDQPEFDKAIVFEEHPDVEKMSEVLLEYAEPLTQMLPEDDDEAFRKALGVAILCWNAALASTNEREEMFRQFVSHTAREDILGADELREILDSMIERKHRLFKDNKRWIINYVVKPTKRSRQVYVVSSLERKQVERLLPVMKTPWWKRLFSWLK